MSEAFSGGGGQPLPTNQRGPLISRFNSPDQLMQNNGGDVWLPAGGRGLRPARCRQTALIGLSSPSSGRDGPASALVATSAARPTRAPCGGGRGLLNCGSSSSSAGGGAGWHWLPRPARVRPAEPARYAN